MSGPVVFLICLGVFLVLLVAFLVYLVSKQKKVRNDTQRHLSDRDLLRRIAREPDGFITPESLSQTTELSKGEARIRLSALLTAGILDQGYNGKLTAFYSLSHPLNEREAPDLSPDPFLTVEDLLVIFKQYDFRPRDQDLIMATGLPLSLIRREMKYFAKENVIDTLFLSAGYGKHSQRTYVLKEPYRSNPEEFRERASRDDLVLREILRNDNHFV